jgi:VCBS repeat-containing protein
MRTNFAAAAFAAALALSIAAPAAQAQKALVYCPVGIDATGCDRIVTALASKFPDGVDRAYDGSNGTLDLKAIDLNHYAVFIVPSLADDDDKQPYALLRAAASRLHLAINGRVAVYSGAPDQGNANRADKDAIIQNLATWAAAGHTRATSLVGMVALLDLSTASSSRYSWVRSVSLADVSADADLTTFGDVTPISSKNGGGDALLAGGAARRFTNMASYGLHIGARAAARTEVGAIGGATAAESNGQSVLVLYSNSDGRSSGGRSGPAALNKAPSSGASLDATSDGGASGPTLTTDKPDYLPGDTVLFSGTGWTAGDTVTITVHEDPQWSNPDRTVSAVADANGNLASHEFVVQQRDFGVTFTATAVGNPSGLVAQTTFTDGNLQLVTIAAPTSVTVVAGVNAQYTVNVTINGNTNQCTVTLSVTSSLPAGSSASFTNSPHTGNSSYSSTLTISTTVATPAGTYPFTVQGARGNDCQGNGDLTTSGTLVVTAANTPPTAQGDSYSTNEDNALNVTAPGVLSNDTDAETPNGLTTVLVTGSGPTHGTLTLNADGSFTYTPNANYNGPDSFKYHAKDPSNAVSSDVTVNLTVNAVNDAPSFTKGADQTVLEDAGAQSVTNWATAISAGPPDESGQTLTFSITDNSNPGLFSTPPSVAANGTLTYTPAADANGSATIKLKLTDNGGTANGGVDASLEQTFVINVTAVNDAPSFTKGADQTVLEDAGAQTVSGWATALSAGPPDESAQTLTFSITNNSNPGLFSAGPTVSATGVLTYTPAANANGSATIKIQLSDNGGTANNGVDKSAEQTFVINVTAVNDAPSFTKGTDPTVNEDAGAQTVAGWATAILAGPPDESGQTLTFNITNNTNSALFSVQPSVAANGTLTYTPAANANGTATITLTLSDNGGTANTGVDTSAPQMFTITINPVNDPPSFTKGADQTALEDAGPQSVSGWATAINAGPANESSQTVSFQITGNTNPGLFSSAPSIASNGTLTFTSAPDANGSATITVVAKDDGGTANGGVDASPSQTFVINVTPVNDAPTFALIASTTVLEDAGAQSVPNALTNPSPGPANESSQTLSSNVTNDNNALFLVQPSIDLVTGALTFTTNPNANGKATVTVTVMDNGGTANNGIDHTTKKLYINVTPVNDAPSFTKGANQTALEDAGAQSVSGWATLISAGPPDESGQALNFIVTNDNNALFSSQPTIDASGKLSYTSAPNANGSATVTVQLHDDGGTANGGVDTSPSQMFTITITAVNDAPTFDLIGNQSILEDAGQQSVPNAVTNKSAGPPDEQLSQTLTLTMTNDNNALFSSQPAVDASGTLTYTPAANANGTTTVTVKVQDNGGTANGGVDQTTKTFLITVTAVNDAPSFTKGPNQTVLEDAGAQNVSWATAISAGPPDESSQKLNFIVTNDNNGLFSSQPAIDPSGKLTYTSAANANGSATVTVQLHDDGGTANLGVDTSPSQTFTITITPVNDAPTFNLIGNQTVLEDAGAQSVPNALTNPSPGPSNESSQAVTVTVTSTNSALFSVQPSIDASGTLTFTSAPNANGNSTVTVKLQDNGGTANGGVDATTKTFTIYVTPVNDPPTITAFAGPLLPTALGSPVTANGTFTDVDLGDSPVIDSHTGTIDWGDGSSSAISVAPGSGTSRNFSGSHTYTATGVYTIVAHVKDSGNLTSDAMYQYVVVYDPTAGFVTGGGWINSPSGAYPADPTLTGKATFGFVSKYKKGQTTPDGDTEFDFHAAGLNFQSTSYEWLVISGTKAQYKGSGTINGSGDYFFMLTAIDGDLKSKGSPDTFRIRIWNKTTLAVIYDNQITSTDLTADPTTTLGGGSIQIHN